jgi:hypothetical protein
LKNKPRKKPAEADGNWIGGWVGPKPGLDAVEKGIISCIIFIKVFY